MITEVTTLDIMITKAKEKLTEATRAAIDAVSWRLILSGINKKYTPDQLYNLETETELLLCGLITPEDYQKELESRMQLHKTEVISLISEIDKLIFKKIQQELENRLNGGGDKGGKIVYTNKPFVVDPRFISLSKKVQEAISYSNWEERMYDIAKKFKLNVEQTGSLEEITTKVILNTIHADQYENEIRSKIDLGDDKIKEMVVDLNENIFKNIKEVMKNAPATDDAERKIPTPPYAKTTSNNQTPTTSEKIIGGETEKKPAQKEIEDIISNNGVGGKEFDIYKEHGIEIVTENEVAPEIKKVSPNIVTDKLFGNTTNKTTVSDYSLPKISRDQENIHDPYHEAI